MSQSWDAAITVASNLDVAAAEWFARLDSLKSSWSGASAPGSNVVEGQLFDLQAGAASGDDELQWRGDPDGSGNGWHEIGAFLHNDCEAIAPANTAYQLVNWRAENLGADITPAAGYVGRFYLRTTDGKYVFAATATKLEVMVSGDNTDLYPVAWIPIGACDLDASNPPTATTVGTTPVVRGMAFNATNEKVSFAFPVPAGVSGDADLTVRVWAYLESGQSPNDTIDATIDLVSLVEGEVPTGTSTQATISYDIGANATQYDLQKFDLTLDYNDATNPLNAGDLVECEFALSSIASVTGIIVRGFQVLSPYGNTIFEG